VAASLSFSGAAFTMLLVLSAARPRWLMDLQQYAANPAAYLGHHLWLVLGSVAAQTVLSLLLVIGFDLGAASTREQRTGQMLPTSVWFRVFNLERPPVLQLRISEFAVTGRRCRSCDA
jgi:hypothetical protein